MKIIFNANNLLIGGGRRIGTGIISSLYNITLEDEIHVFLPKKNYYSFASTDNIKIHYLPSFTKFFPGFLLSFYVLFQFSKIKPDAVFSLGNYAIPTSKKQLLLLQWPYAAYPDSIVWHKMNVINYLKRKFRLFLLKKNLRFTSAVTVQTELMKMRLGKYLNYSGLIKVIESSGNHITKAHEVMIDPRILSLKKTEDDKLFLFMSEYYTHKNLEVIIPLANLIHKNNLPYKILLTLATSSNDASNLLDEVKKFGLEDIIINLGRIDQDYAISVYKSCDALLFPTLLETYGFPYLEAAYCKLPIFTSDLDFARGMNDNNAWYFNPLSPESILKTIREAYENPELMKIKVEDGYQKASSISSWEEITMNYIEIIKSM